MNRLGQENSPYLLQHADNPVHWYPWGEEAFQEAARRNVPVLVSIGYSSCHWCHVMAHESFEDSETADLMNALYVNIKIDREEYPDVDHMYMDAVQAMTGSGGWPLNVFVMPDKRPFYGGTYFPPRRAHHRAAWKEVLVNVSQYYQQNKNEVLKQADQLIQHLQNLSNPAPKLEKIVDFDAEKILEKLLSNADTEWGGFGAAPKFPSTFQLNFLLKYHLSKPHGAALDQVRLSLDKMWMGGIYDHLCGGFARYSTDKFWIAPHFEKMLYDNALLLPLYARMYQLEANPFHLAVVRQSLKWLKEEMYDVSYGFYAARDADTEGQEGKYYTWEAKELKNLVKDDFETFAQVYNVEEGGNWEHTNILFLTTESLKKSAKTYLEKREEWRTILLAERRKRPEPLTDDKIILAWNALMISALVEMALILEDADLLEWAEEAMNTLEKQFAHPEYLYLHSGRKGQMKLPAYLDDLAYLAKAMIDMGNATAQTLYYHRAKAVLEYVCQHFKSENDHLFDFVHHEYEQVQIRKKDIYDNALPSANVVLFEVMQSLALIFQENCWSGIFENGLNAMRAYISGFPAGFSRWAALALDASESITEVVIIGPDAKKIYQSIYNKVQKPNVQFVVSIGEEENIASLKDKNRQGDTLVYICKDFSCLEPLTDINQVLRVIL